MAKARELFEAIAKLPSFAPTVGTAGTNNMLRVEMRRAAHHEVDYLLRDTVLGILNDAVNAEESAIPPSFADPFDAVAHAKRQDEQGRGDDRR